MSTEKNKFTTALELNVSDKVEKKGGLSYLSWSFAWSEFKKIYTDGTYKIIKNENNLPYFHDQKAGFMVYTEVTADGETHEMWLPVMDFRNKAMSNPTMFDINKTIMRCLTKNLAMFGIGLYIYSGDDLPENCEDEPTVKDTESDDDKDWFNLFDKQGNAHQNKWDFAWSCWLQSENDVNVAINKIAEIYKVNGKEREYLKGALK